MSADAPLLYDWAGVALGTSNAPITGRPGQSLNTTAQGGMVALGADAGGVARVPRVDANGSLYAIQTNPAGTSNTFYQGQPAPAATSQYGTLLMGRQDAPSPSTFYSVTLDPVMAVQAHLKSKPSFKALARGVPCSTNANLVALYNGSTMVLRVNEVQIYIPLSGSGGALLGSSTSTYYAVKCEMRRVATAYTGGTSITPFSSDSGDVVASGIVCASLPTIATTQANSFHMADAYCTSFTGIPYYGRNDANQKTLVVRPGEGVVVVCVSNGVINNANGSSTTQALADIELTVTQATA